MDGPDPYRTLGLARESSPEEIRSAFRRAVLRRHPDTSAEPDDGASVRDILAAYRLLIDPADRARYDAAHPVASDPIRHRIPVRRVAVTPSPAPRRCPDCQGRGRVAGQTTCPVCDGHAEYTIVDLHSARVFRCGTCRGVGQVGARKVCPTCGGRGVTG